VTRRGDVESLVWLEKRSQSRVIVKSRDRILFRQNSSASGKI